MGKRKKTDWIIIVDVKKLVRFLILLAMCVLAVLSGYQTVKRFVKVKNFEIVGIFQYDKEDIIHASGVKRGDRLYSVDGDEVAERIRTECPYLAEITVKKKFPNTLYIEAEGKSGQWYLEVAGICYALDGDLQVITDTKKTDGMTKLILPRLKSVMVGAVPEFGESEIEIKKTLEVISAIRQTAFKSRLTMVDLESRWNIHITVDGIYEIEMGDMTNFDAKLRAVAAILEEDYVKNSGGGSMYVSESGTVEFRAGS